MTCTLDIVQYNIPAPLYGLIVVPLYDFLVENSHIPYHTAPTLLYDPLCASRHRTTKWILTPSVQLTSHPPHNRTDSFPHTVRSACLILYSLHYPPCGQNLDTVQPLLALHIVQSWHRRDHHTHCTTSAKKLVQTSNNHLRAWYLLYHTDIWLSAVQPVLVMSLSG